MTWYLLFFSWLIATIATFGSLFFSEVMGFPPCVLCWYQRICMYPLTALLLVGLFPVRKDAFNFAFPLVVIGWFISLYHNLLQYEVIPESASPCSQGISCAASYISWFGFITIPFLSFVAFTLIGLLLIIFMRKFNEKR